MREPVRLRALASTGLMAAAPAPAFTRLAQLAADLTGAVLAYVSLVDAERLRIVGAVGPAGPIHTGAEADAEGTLCRWVVEADAPLIVADGREHPFRALGVCPEAFGIGSYLGVPLRTADGSVLGAVCVAEPGPRAWSARDLARVEQVARLASDQLLLHLEVAARASAEDDLQRSHRSTSAWPTTRWT
jgi:GAF domain-containing protein